jgi:hypothetical protein
VAFATDYPLGLAVNTACVATEGDVAVPKRTKLLNIPRLQPPNYLPINALPGDRPAGPMEDVIRLEMAILDAQAAGRHQIVLLRYDPEELLDPAIPTEQLQPVASGVAVQINPTGEEVSIRRLDDWPAAVN